MKIKRTINGIEYEFELTEQERFDTYCEQEHIWDVDYEMCIRDRMDAV